MNTTKGTSMSTSEHTPGPWHWGDGFKELERDPRDPNREYSGPKYADIGLWGPNGETVLPLRIDHHSIEWDSPNELDDLTPANRALIAQAPELLAERDRLRDINRALVEVASDALVTLDTVPLVIDELRAVLRLAQERHE